MPSHADVLQWEHLPFPKSLRDFQRLFPDEAARARYLEGAKWSKGFVCPHCGEIQLAKMQNKRIYWIAPESGKDARAHILLDSEGGVN